jgi:PKD repeat protein
MGAGDTGNTQQGQQDSGGGFESLYEFVEVQFTDTSSGADSVLWNFGDGNTSTERNPKHKFYENGNYNVTLTVTNSAGEALSQESVQIDGIGDDTGEGEVTNETEVIYGCTDPTATNYDSNATQEDGSCQYNSEQETTSTEPRPTNPPSGYNPMFGNFRIGAASPGGLWTWNGYAWILNSSTTTVTGTDNDDTSATESEDTSGDDSDTGDDISTFNYTLTGNLSGRQAGVNTTFNIDVDSVNYSSLLPELSNYIGQTMTANGVPRTITNFQTSAVGYSITLQGIVGNNTPGAVYYFNIDITSTIDLSNNNDDGDNGDDGGGYGGRPGVTGP